MARVKGDKELRQALRSVSAAPTGRVLDGICVQALTPMRDMIDVLAPRPSLKGTATIAKRDARSQFFRVFWIAFRGMGLKVAHLVEFGTQPHSLKKGASVRKGIFVGEPPMHPGTRPEPFARPAFEATKNEVANTLGQRVWAAILSAVK